MTVNEYEILMQAKHKIGKLKQVQRTHLCGGGTIDNIVHYIVAKTYDDRIFYIKPEEADKAEEIINAK